MNIPISVIHVSTATSWRGGEQQLAYLLKALKEAGVKQHVLCVKDAPFSRYCIDNQIDHTAYIKIRAVSLQAAKLLRRLSGSLAGSLVHCHDSHAHTIAYLSALVFRNSKPVIIHRRVDFPVKSSMLSRLKYNHASVVRFICVSNAIREILIPALKNPEKAEVVYSGIDLERFTNTKKGNTLRKEFNLSDQSILIGNIAALAPHKDYFTFLKTAAILIKNNPDFRFVIVGEGPDRSIIENKIRESGLTETVLLAGFRTNIPEILKELNVLLLSSKTEGLGTTILDAFAGGLPVVATKAGGIPEIVEHEVTGLLAGIGEAEQLALMTERMLNDKMLRDRVIRNGLEKVKSYDYTFTADKILNIYKKVLQLTD